MLLEELSQRLETTRWIDFCRKLQMKKSEKLSSLWGITKLLVWMVSSKFSIKDSEMWWGFSFVTFFGVFLKTPLKN